MSEQEQQQIKTSPYASPMYNHGSSIILLTNPDNELRELELDFRGLNIDDQGNIKQVTDPLMNEKGIKEVLKCARSIISQVTVFSNLTNTQIMALQDYLGDTLARSLIYSKKYGIKNKEARDTIYFSVLAKSFICMNRATEEGERRFWKGSTQEIITKSEMPQTGLTSFLGWNKRR